MGVIELLRFTKDLVIVPAFNAYHYSWFNIPLLTYHDNPYVIRTFFAHVN